MTITTDIDITTLSASAFAALTVSEIKSLSSTQCAAIAPSQLSSLPAEKIAALSLNFISTSTLTGISTSAINGLVIKNLSNEQIQALTTEQMSALTAKKFANFSPEQLTHLTTMQIAAANLSALDSEQIGALTVSQLSALNTSHLSSLSNEALEGLNSNHITGLNTIQINALASVLKPNQLNGFSNLTDLGSQTLAAISPETLKAINANISNINQLTPQQIAQLTPEKLANLSNIELATITSQQASVLRPSQLMALNSTQATQLTSSAIAAIRPIAIKYLNLSGFDNADIAALTTKQVAYLTIANVAQISATNANGLTATQINAMKLKSLQSLSAAARDALGEDAYYAYQIRTHAPTVTNLDAVETYTEDTSLNLVNDLEINTITPNVTVTLTLSNLSVGSFNSATSGNVTSTFNSGVWTANGAITDVNTLLAGLIFTPAVNFNNDFTITTSVADEFSSAVTGIKSFTGIAVNDAPVATNSTVITNEDTMKTFAASDFGFIDIENNTLSAVIIASLPAVGTLKLNGVDVTNNQEILVADIGNLTFIPETNANGNNYASFSFKVRDNGGTANGGTDTSTAVTMTINITPVNDLPTFSIGDGKVVTDFGNSIDYGQSAVLQPDGKIIVAGMSSSDSGLTYHFTLARYNSNGSLDISFGSGGKVISALTSFDNAYDVTLQSDGKILVTGHGNSANSFILARYNANGSLDISGVNGAGFYSNGFVTTNFGTSLEVGHAVTTQKDGKIIVVGTIGSGAYANSALARYNSDGSLDSGFGGGSGKVITDFTGSQDEAFAVAIQPDDKILVSGQHFTGGSTFDFALARYNSDGTLDTGFGSGGKVITPANSPNAGSSLVIQSDGKILVAGSSGADFALFRYTTAGALDVSFNGTGKVFTDFSNSTDYGYSVVLQEDGKIIVAGSSNGYFALARYNVDGTLDNSFDVNGKVVTNLSFAPWANATVLVQADGKILISGTTNGSNADFGMIRYNSDGSLDTSFNVSLVTGTPTQGQTLSIATNSIIDTDGLGAFSYQWKKADGTVIAATPTLLLTQNEVGQTITATVSYTDAGGTTECITSSPTSAVVNINDAPIATDSTVTTNKDTPKTFVTSDFSFTDVENNELSAIIITRLPSAGTLNLNGVAVTENQEILVADIENLTFTPAANTDGNNYASFDFKVKDNGGVTNGGVDISTNTATITINVIAVNNFSVSAELSETDTNNPYRDGRYVDIYPLTGFSNGDLVTISLNAGFDTYLQIVRNGVVVEYNDDSNDSLNSQITYIYQTGDLIYATSFTSGATGQYTLTANKQFTPPTTPQIYNNHTYILSNSATWQQAQAQAVVLGGNLVTINNAIENAWLVSTFGSTEEYWIGLTDETTENTFVWVNDENTSYRNWATSPIQQPDNTNNQDYGIINWGETPGGWDDQGMNISHRGIIEIPYLNVAPTATNVTVAETYTEDTPLNLTDIVVTDNDSANGTAMLTLSDITVGNFNVATSNAVTSTYDSQTGIWRASGAIADVNSLLAGLTFTPKANFNGNFTIAVSISDGIAPTLTGIKNFTGTSVNDAPTIAALPPSNALQNPATGNYYSLSTLTTWQNAENQAIESGGHLVTVNNQAEQDWLVNNFDNNELFWIGFNDRQIEGTFSWVSGEFSNYTNWNIDNFGNYEPNNAGAYGNVGEDYAVMNWDNRVGNKGKWNDTSGSFTGTDSYDSHRGIIEIAGTLKITLFEDTTRNFQLNNFGSDVDGNLVSVIITSLPEKGLLKLNGETVTTGQIIPVNSISTLTFTPAANENGANYTTIPYILADSVDETVNGSLAIDVITVNDAPTGSVTISGTPQVGQTLTASNDLADTDGLGTISYQWKADNTIIDGALSSNYVLVAGDVNKTITVTASYTDGGGTVEAVTSGATIQIVGSV